MLSVQDAFKVGFLSRCIADGVPTERIVPLIKEAQEKVAGLADLLGKGVGLGGKALGATAGAVAGWGLPIAALAPPVLGAAAGYGLARATDLDDTDVDDIKDTELLDEYHRQTEQLKRESAMRRYARQRQRTGRMFH